MRTTALPTTDLRISVLTMGCWALSGDATWGPQDEQVAIAAVHAALDQGINCFDTAPMYGNGIANRRLGAALKGRRDKAVIADKILPHMMAAKDVVAGCEESLKQLGTDYIDLYQIHWPSRTVPLAETWAAMQKLKDQGKIRALGVSNFGIGDLTDLLALGRPATNQLPYSLITRGIEWEVLPRCRAAGVGVLCYSSLGLSLLTDKYADADEVPIGRARTRHFSSKRALTRHGEPGCEEETFTAINAIRKIARSIGCTMPDLAIAWLLHKPGITSIITGIRTPEQAKFNAAAVNITLAPEQIAELDRVTEPVKQYLGRNLDMWDSTANSRYR
jgi:aryl-alcohol dehydrogenase-like predicted oxidoreductase